jgi:hypothetical protein
VECKRLGFTTKARWNLNEEYVISGIQRFRSSKYRYGMHMAEGIMIGYVQSMGLPEVYADVTKHAAATGTPPPVLAARGWQSRSVTDLAHQFDRGFPVSPFHLTHLWLDIQDIPTRPRTAPPTKKPKPQRTKKRAQANGRH